MTLVKTIYTLASAAALLSHSVSATTAPMAKQVSIKAGNGDGTMMKNGNLPAVMDVHNGAKEDVRWVCWKAPVASGQPTADVRDNTPVMNDVIPAGATHTYSAQQGVVLDCTPVYPNTQMTVFGTIVNTLFSFTHTSGFGLFYVDGSSLPGGDTISAKSEAGCTSDHDHCSWECSDVSNCPGSSKQTTCSGPGAVPAVDGNGGCTWNSGKVLLLLANTAKNVTSSSS